MTSLSLLSLLLSIYAVVTGLFLISENRRPQSTLAWMLAFLFAPGIGVVIYFFFGRHRKAFAKRSRLLRQSFDHRVVPVLSALQVRQGAAVRRLEAQGPLHRKLVRLVTQNALSSLTTRNQVEILQNASSFYPSLLKDIEEAQHSIHLQFFIWRVDEFTTQLKNLLIAKAKEGVKVRLLYDPIGSFFSMSRHYVAKLRAGGIQMAPTSPHLPASHHQLPQPPQDHRDRWPDRLSGRDEHGAGAPGWGQRLRGLARYPDPSRGGSSYGSTDGLYDRLV